MRGKLPSGCGSAASVGITPAGAGKTTHGMSVAWDCWDHPRRCGENCYSLQPKRKRARITPAGAGKTRRQSRKSVTARDHPRRCGENENADLSGLVGTGSPPQVRGKRIAAINPSTTPRITPAGAGKTQYHKDKKNKRQDHPRRCGENSLARVGVAESAGSPPQVRGKLHMG